MTDIAADELFHFIETPLIPGGCILLWREPMGEYTAKLPDINHIGRLTDMA
jgi:hypothetical protein